MKNILLRLAGACAFLAMPALASAAEGFSTANVNMRSGPSTRYPAVIIIPAGESVEIHGCLADRPWCDVSFYGGRGWVAGRYVQAVYRSNRVYVEPEYYRPLGIPTVVFEFDRYWDRYYRGRDFYRDRNRWRGDTDWIEERRERGWERRRERERSEWESARERERREWQRHRDDDRWRRRVDEDDLSEWDEPRRERRYAPRNGTECAFGDFRCEDE